MFAHRAILLAIPLLTACVSPSTHTHPTDQEFTDWVETRYAAPFKSGDTDDWLSVFAEDAVALHNRRGADVGKEAIASFGALVASTFEVDEMDVTVEEVRVNGDWAFTRGSYVNSFSFRDSGEPAPWGRERGKFFFLWERQSDDEWKIIVDMGNSAE